MTTLGARDAFPYLKDAPDDKPLSRLLVSTVGAITTGPVAETLLQQGSADVIFVARQFQRNPSTVWTWADELSDGSKVIQLQLAAQIRWGFAGRGKKTSDGKEDHAEKSGKENNKVGTSKV
jgi:hypothetical protein